MKPADMKLLVNLDACREGRIWAARCENLEELWRTAENGRWLFWLATVAGAPARDVAAAMAAAARPMVEGLSDETSRATCLHALEVDASGPELATSCRAVAESEGPFTAGWAAALLAAEVAEYLGRRGEATTGRQLHTLAEVFGREVYRAAGAAAVDAYESRAAELARQHVAWADVDRGLEALRRG